MWLPAQDSCRAHIVSATYRLRDRCSVEARRCLQQTLVRRGSQPRVRYSSEETRERLVMKADPSAKSGAIARAAVRPADAAITRSKMPAGALRTHESGPQGADEARMQASGRWVVRRVLRGCVAPASLLLRASALPRRARIRGHRAARRAWLRALETVEKVSQLLTTEPRRGPGTDLTAHRYACSLPTGSQNRTPENE